MIYFCTPYVATPVLYAADDIHWIFTEIEREKKKTEKAVRDAAKRNDMASAKVCVWLKGWLEIHVLV